MIVIPYTAITAIVYGHMPKCYSGNLYTDLGSIYTALIVFLAYDSDNLDLVDIWTGTCLSAAISIVYISCNSSNRIFG